MNDSLFDIPEQLSPRLAWLRANNVVTHPPGWTPTISASLKKWLTAHSFCVSPPLEGEWDEYAVMYGDGSIVTEGDSISDAIAKMVDRIPDPGVHPDEARMPLPKLGKWSAVIGFKLAIGDSEEEAICALAQQLGLKLWNQ